MSQHTPGPWSVSNNELDVIDGDLDNVCTVRFRYCNGHKDHGATNANAHLIAAAPALADALREMLAAFFAGPPDADSDLSNKDRLVLTRARAALRAAGLEP